MSNLFEDFKDAFSEGPRDIGLAEEVRHGGDTENEQPIRQRTRNIPLAKRAEADQAVAIWKNMGLFNLPGDLQLSSSGKRMEQQNFVWIIVG